MLQEIELVPLPLKLDRVTVAPVSFLTPIHCPVFTYVSPVVVSLDG